MKFTAEEYSRLAGIVFRDDYPGYTPHIVEDPNRDGNVDAGKLYAHVSAKNLAGMANPLSPDAVYLRTMFQRAVRHARAVALMIGGIPNRLWPAYETSALRILKYPPGVGGHAHTDFDLFTTILYRSPREGLLVDKAEVPIDHINPGMHFGEIAFEACDIPATKHSVRALDEEQHSIVFLAMPPLDAEIRAGLTVGEWLKPHIEAARVDTRSDEYVERVAEEIRITPETVYVPERDVELAKEVTRPKKKSSRRKRGSKS